MTKPINRTIDAVSNVAERVIHPIISATTRALTPPGLQPSQAPTINLPDPTQSTPAKIPGSKPAGGQGLRESFLSGVVGGAAAQGLQGGSWDWRGGGAQGGQSGKSLIGA